VPEKELAFFTPEPFTLETTISKPIPMIEGTISAVSKPVS
jgi:hypothetical protein